VPEEPNGQAGEGLLSGVKVIELAHFVFGPAGPRPAPGFGADTDEVLVSELGMDFEEVLELKITGVVG
jgi:crotonobetainyl-CoA:carnitine CoA-transferase CaiB-like acyl-CoA transferase